MPESPVLQLLKSVRRYVPFRITLRNVGISLSASTVSLIGFLIYLAPGNSTKKRVVGRELVRSWLLTLRKSKLLFNMFGSGIIFTFLSKYPMNWFQWKVSRLRVFASYIITFWLTQYTLHYMEYPHARFQRTFWNVQLVEKSRLQKLRFDPIPWLMNTHQQTLVGFVLGHLEWILFNQVTFRREIVKAYDGNDLFLDWFEHPDDEEDEQEMEDENMTAAEREERQQSKKRRQRMSDKQKATLPIVLIVHGLGDHRFIPYMKRLARACHRNGWRPVAYSYWEM